MAAKLLHSLSDDNTDLQRQIGCMTGIFQLFDRQQIITGRRIGGLSPKRLPSGSSRIYGDNFEAESNSIYHRPTTKEKKPAKDVYEKQRVVSVESSRPSFSSSSRSSSFSSLDYNIKINKPDPSPYDRIIFPETPSRDPSMTQPNASPQYARSSLDLRDVVKDSIYRDTWGLSVKPTMKDEMFDHSRTSFESRSGGSMYYASNDAPRFSYDSRETIRSAIKHKELPRLSLDSREGSIRSFNSDNKAAGPSVVAKLMGLETLPDAEVAIDNCEPFLRSSKPIVVPVSNFVRNSWKEPASPRRRNGEVAMKPVLSSRFPIEPAPWKYHDGAQKTSLRNVKTPLKYSNATIPSVYSEIEKRLKNIEFTQSGKDLRALKQIIEAMQAKGILDDSTRREGEDGNFPNQRDLRPTFSKSPMNAKLMSKERAFESPIVIMKPAKLVSKSGISSSSVIPMDPLSTFHNSAGEKYLNNRKGFTNNRASKEQVPKMKIKENGATLTRPSKSGLSLVRTHNLSRENASSSVKNSTSVSPRLQQKKLEMEKKSRPPISPDSNKSRRQPIKTQAESNSLGGKRRPKIVKKQQSDDQLSDVSSESKGLSYQDDDLEVTSLSGSNGSRSPSLKAAKYAVSGFANQRIVPKLIEEGELGEVGSVAPEQPSPVSVLDHTMYADDALSPVKQKPDVLKDEATVKDIPNREEHKVHEKPVSSTTINRKKLENIENLVKKLRRLNSTHDETHTDYIASLCENTNPDHRYISEILLASGLLLRDLNSSLSMFQLHPSGYPINPELFLVLEQTKASTLEKEQFGFGKIVRVKCEKEKFHRKLIFDAVNEILLKKLAVMGTNTNKLAKRSLSAQKLLRDLCSEIENLEKKKTSFLEDEDDSLKSILCDDVMNRSESWTEYNGDLSGLVLDIERLLFKDLISEIVLGEAVRTKAGRRCRQLFA